MRRIIALLTAVILCLIPLCVHAEDSPATQLPEKNASLRLLKELYQAQNTLVFSPLSLTIALSMAEAGAAGETYAQLNSFLGEKRPDWMLIDDLSFSGAELANAAFLRPEFTLLPAYADVLTDEYEADTFLMEEGNVLNQVNDWVSENTDGLIDDLLSEEPGAETMMLLINALSMQAEWRSPFDPANTLPALFHAPDGDIEVSSMNQSAYFMYGETDDVQSVALPYRNSSLEMIVLLPNDGNLQALVDQLCAAPDEFTARHTAAHESTLVQLSLPNVCAESSFELKDALMAQGVTDAFNPDTADFSAMAENALDMDLHIGRVLQKTILKVNETGTEAAAATQVAMLARGAMNPKTAVMTVDKPFMLLVHDPASGYVLFAACINNPA